MKPSTLGLRLYTIERAHWGLSTDEILEGWEREMQAERDRYEHVAKEMDAASRRCVAHDLRTWAESWFRSEARIAVHSSAARIEEGLS